VRLRRTSGVLPMVYGDVLMDFSHDNCDEVEVIAGNSSSGGQRAVAPPRWRKPAPTGRKGSLSATRPGMTRQHPFMMPRLSIAWVQRRSGASGPGRPNPLKIVHINLGSIRKKQANDQPCFNPDSTRRGSAAGQKDAQRTPGVQHVRGPGSPGARKSRHTVADRHCGGDDHTDQRVTIPRDKKT